VTERPDPPCNDPFVLGNRTSILAIIETFDYDKSGDIVGFGSDGRRVTLFPPILGTSCDRCSSRADDVSFLIEGGVDERVSGGLCGDCLIQLLAGEARR